VAVVGYLAGLGADPPDGVDGQDSAHIRSRDCSNLESAERERHGSRSDCDPHARAGSIVRADQVLDPPARAALATAGLSGRNAVWHRIRPSRGAALFAHRSDRPGPRTRRSSHKGASVVMVPVTRRTLSLAIFMRFPRGRCSAST